MSYQTRSRTRSLATASVAYSDVEMAKVYNIDAEMADLLQHDESEHVSDFEVND